jgi:hypothetical protein
MLPLATGRWFFPGTPVSCIKQKYPDRYDIVEVLLKVALNTINQTDTSVLFYIYCASHFYDYLLQLVNFFILDSI